jgi:hypothetical protein
MKKYIIVLWITLFMGLTAQAQNSTTEYDTCSALRLREGEWLSIQGQDTIRIFLRYHRTYDIEYNIISDRLWGWHEYKKGSQVIQSNYQHRFMPLDYIRDNINIENRSIWLRFDPKDFDMPNAERGLYGTITDSEYLNKPHGVIISFSTRFGVLKMTWNQQFLEYIGSPFEGKPFTMALPSTFVLTKQ